MRAILGTFRPDLFAGRTVLVSGASSGIGLAVARGFAGLGASTIATGSNAAKLEAGRADPANAGLRFERLDVRDSAAVAGFVGGLPALDVLVNAQGIARPDEEFTEATFAEVLDVNLVSTMRLAMAARPHLAASRGSILMVASMLSYLSDASVPAYGASKAGILGLVRHLAHAFGLEGIRVNAIAPGYHTTDMTRPLWEDPGPAARIAERSALKRWGTVEDLVGAALFLSSPAAAFVTGADIPIDGGFVVGSF